MDEPDPHDDELTQQCEGCQRVLPLDSKHFSRAPGCTYKFRRVCKKCRKKQQRQGQLDKIEASAVEAFVAKTVSGGPNIPHTAELLEAMFNYFGGVNGFASIAMKQYWDAKPGSRIRSGILEMMSRLTTKNTEQGGARKPIDLYSEDELEAEIEKRIMNALLITQGRRIVDGIPQAPAGSHAAAAPSDEVALQLSDRRTQELAERAFRSADGVASHLPADAEAVGVPPRPGE